MCAPANSPGLQIRNAIQYMEAAKVKLKLERRKTVYSLRPAIHDAYFLCVARNVWFDWDCGKLLYMALPFHVILRDGHGHVLEVLIFIAVSFHCLKGRSCSLKAVKS